ALGLDPAVLEHDVAQRQGLLRVVGIEPRHPPAVRLPLPGPRAVDEIDHLPVVRPDLLSTEPFQGGPQGIPHGKSEQTSADAIDAAHVRHRGKAPSDTGTIRPRTGRDPFSSGRNEITDGVPTKPTEFCW